MGRGRPPQGAQGWREADPRVPVPGACRLLGIRGHPLPAKPRCGPRHPVPAHSSATLPSQATQMPRTGGTSEGLGREHESLLLSSHERVNTLVKRTARS